MQFEILQHAWCRCKKALAGMNVQSVILPDGEEYKSLEVLSKVWDAALQHRFNRNCTFVALGGGVIGDMCGFAAASYQRGVNFVQVCNIAQSPTPLNKTRLSCSSTKCVCINGGIEESVSMAVSLNTWIHLYLQATSSLEHSTPKLLTGQCVLVHNMPAGCRFQQQ